MRYAHSKKRKKRNFSPKREASGTHFSSVSGSAFRGVLFSLLCLIILSLLSSVFCLYHNDPASITFPIGLSLMYLSSAIGGILSARRFTADKGSALFSGTLCGFFIFVITGIFSVIMTLGGIGGNKIRLPIVLLLRSLCIISAFLGAYIVSGKEKTRYKRKK